MKAMQKPQQAQSLSMAQLLQMLEMTQTVTERPNATAWIGTPQTEPRDRVFGGLQLAQAIVAAGNTVPETQELLTLQADFLQGVPTDSLLTWIVEDVASTPNASARRSSIINDDGNQLFTALTRWSTLRADLPSHKPTQPLTSVASPDDLPSLHDRFHDDDRIPLWWRMNRPINPHPVSAPPYVSHVEQGDTQSTLLRPAGEVPNDPVIQAALVGYATDMSILEPAFRATGAMRHAPDSRILTMTHALTFHQIPDWSTWLHFDAKLEALSHGRAFGSGEVFSPAGEHLVSASQVGFVKLGGRSV